MSKINKIINKEKDKQKLIKEINRAKLDVETAEHFFQIVSDPELVDVAIYELEAKKSRYRYLIKVAKDKGIKKTLQESLIEALAK
ncbi:YaaL family protein [Romboutsia lituseburensis]|uniref:YaaL family protein n=1 Tax=Romboutsia lituseburensis TaxID=1537 RepID=UPI00215AEEAE|nr:YaaL family protein [Romboutsia lituseburensis]MCR8745920.1 YaaL family protein [Romboutsia lituseburensis]